MKRVKFLDLKGQYESIKEKIDTAIQETINSTSFINGAINIVFEKRFASLQEAEHCIGVANGTDAIEIVIEALDLPPNSEIIVPANSFIASSEAITRSGHRVVFADCDPYNYTISIDSVKKHISPKTSAILAVHLYGHPCDMDALNMLAEEHDLKIIEDCAQAHTAEYKGRRVGCIGHAGTFSFYPGKNLGAYGDAGAIVTNDKELAIKCKMIANHGRIEKYNHVFEGRNSRLDSLQAAIINAKIDHVEEWTQKRIDQAAEYKKLLKDIDEITLPNCENWAKQVYHLFVIRCKNRDVLRENLKEKGIETGIHYPIALPKLKAYDYITQETKDFFAYTADEQLLSLPIGEHLKFSDLKYVASAIDDYYSSE